MTCVNVEEEARLAGQRMLDPRIDVQRAFRPQAAAPAVNAVHRIEVGKLTINAAATAKSRVLR